jgi:hypothetical protein
MTTMRSFLVRTAATFLLSALFLSPLVAQEDSPAQEVVRSGEVVRLFLDCQGGGCRDMDYFRTEIQFVNWMRDREDSDVHLLITSQGTGAGGRSYELLFLGRDRFEGMVDTLTYISGYDATQDEVRGGMTDMIKIGLMRYVGLTGLAGNIVIGMQSEEAAGGPGGGGAVTDPEEDPWNFWVFRARLSGFATGESTRKYVNGSGSFTASRTTEEWKISTSLRTGYNETRYDYEDLQSTTVKRNHGFSGLVVKSLTGKWSAGVRAGAASSNVNNYDLKLDLAPVLEFNFFPYSESTRRMLTFQYAVEATYANYAEETVFFENEEFIMGHEIVTSLDLTQPWGSTNLYAGAGHFFKDIALHHVDVGGFVDVRLARGFSVNFGGSFSRIQDRISVARSEATVEDVLLQRKQLQTDYYFFFNFGVSYTFGSVFNNIVNPRLGGGGGGMMIMY